MRRNPQYTEPDRIKERIQYIKDRAIFRANKDAQIHMAIAWEKQAAEARRLANRLAI